MMSDVLSSRHHINCCQIRTEWKQLTRIVLTQKVKQIGVTNAYCDKFATIKRKTTVA